MARPIRRLILWIGGSLAGLVVLLLAAVAVLVFVVDADTYRPRIETIASRQLDRPVSLGRLHWDIGWRIGLASEGGAVANAPGFEGAAMARWQRISFGLVLRPLLRRQVRVDHLTVDGLELDLQRDAAGMNNWTFPTQGPAESDTQTPFAIEGVTLRSSRVRYRDASSAADWTLAALDLEASFEGGTIDTLTGLRDVELAGRLSGGPLTGADGVSVRFAADEIGFDTGSQRLNLPAFEAEFGEAMLSGRVEARAGDSPAATGQLKMEIASLRALMTTLGITPPPMRDSTTLGELSLEAGVQFAGGALDIAPLRLQLDDTSLSGNARLARFSPPSLRFDLDADEIDLDRYLEPPETESEPFELPVEQLKALDATGVLRIREARVAGALARPVTISVE